MMESDQDASAVASQIASFVRDQFGARYPSQINQDSELFREGIVDSMGILTLMRFLEQTFQVQLNDWELFNKRGIGVKFRIIER